MNYIERFKRMRKAAGVGTGVVGDQAPVFLGRAAGRGGIIAGNIARWGGRIAGLTEDPATEQEPQAAVDQPSSLIPGLGSYRLARRRTGESKKLGFGKEKAVSEFVGPVTSALIPGLIGAALGAKAGQALVDKRVASACAQYGLSNAADVASVAHQMDSTKRNVMLLLAGAGATLGAGIPMALGGLAALATKRRTQQDQKEYEAGSSLGNWVLPGVGAYNQFKSLGYMMGEDEKRKATAGK